ncbi:MULTISPECIES: hypothetical protein [Actinomycetes]|nr:MULTISPECIES: hypothetical protein [Actinomycetes]
MQSTDVSKPLTAVVQDHRLSFVFAPAEVQVPPFGSASLAG